MKTLTALRIGRLKKVIKARKALLEAFHAENPFNGLDHLREGWKPVITRKALKPCKPTVSTPFFVETVTEAETETRDDNENDFQEYADMGKDGE